MGPNSHVPNKERIGGQNVTSDREPGPLTLARTEALRPSMFRPPSLRMKVIASSKTALTPTAAPWYPKKNGTHAEKVENGCSNNVHPRHANETRLVAPVALGQSPARGSTQEVGFSASMCTRNLFSPLMLPLPRVPSAFTQAATESRVYSVEMFTSVSHDAAHTPFGVLKWAVKHYLRNPTLKVPSHLQLSLHVATEGANPLWRGALGSNLRTGSHAKSVRLTQHKVLSILSRLTPAKYELLVDELKLLPIRQVDDAELGEICRIFFDKAINEPSYTALYARLAHDMCCMKEQNQEGKSREQYFTHRFRKLLIGLCEVQFHKPLQLSGDDLVNRATGVRLSDEEIRMKHTQLKGRLVGNIRFVAELFKVGVVTEHVVSDIIHVLVNNYDPSNPTASEEHIFEVFSTLVKLTGELLKEKAPDLLAQSLGVAKSVELSHPKRRICFMMMDLDDINKRNLWVAPELVQRYVQELHHSPSAPGTHGGNTAVAPAPKLEKQVSPRDETDAPSRACASLEMCSVLVQGELAPSSDHNNIVDTVHLPGANSGCHSVVPISSSGCCSNNKKSDSNTESGQGNNCSDICRPTSPLPSISVTECRHGRCHNPYNGVPLIETVNSKDKMSQLDVSTSPKNLMNSFSPPSSDSDTTMTCQTSVHRRGCSMMGISTSNKERNSRDSRDGLRTSKIVNIKEFTKQLIEMFRDGEEKRAAELIGNMSVKYMVICLTWWLRLCATHPSFFVDCSKVARLFSYLLVARTGANDLCAVFSTMLEWIQFDVENRLYDKCPQMFKNVAEMVLTCHLECSDLLPKIDVVRSILNCGLFNIFVRQLCLKDGMAAIPRLVGACYPVSLQILGCLHDSMEDKQILRVAMQNRFHLLLLLLVGGEGKSLTLPSKSCTFLTSGGCHSDGEPSPTAVQFNTLSQCLAASCLEKDPELVLFHLICNNEHAGDSPAPWCDEAIRMALDNWSGGMTVCKLVALMPIVGTVLVGTYVRNSDGQKLVSEIDLEYVLRAILNARPGLLAQAAAVGELIAYHTQVSMGSASSAENEMERLLSLKIMFDRWCSQELIEREAVTAFLSTVYSLDGCDSFYASYFESMTGVSWHTVISVLCGR
ncbi:putative eukaryotic initiation factor 4a [Trypanosoma vivax]|nr:putative eukaryotic initiation factor 4a [Trypanosoma vivax]